MACRFLVTFNLTYIEGSDGCVEDVEQDAGRDGAERCVLVKMGYICAGGLGSVMGVPLWIYLR